MLVQKDFVLKNFPSNLNFLYFWHTNNTSGFDNNLKFLKRNTPRDYS